MIEQLYNAGFLCIYEIEGETLIYIKNWLKHQKPHPKEQQSGKPLPDNTLENTVKINLKDMLSREKDSTSKVGSCLLSLGSGELGSGELGNGILRGHPGMAQQIWEYYVSKFSKRKDMSRISFRDDLVKATLDRLKKYSLEDIKLAIDHMYEDLDVWEHRIKNCDLQQVVRSEKKLEYWLAWEKTTPKQKSSGTIGAFDAARTDKFEGKQ